LVYNDKTYTATKDQILTITDCPCTITKPANPTATPTGAPVDCYKQENECRTKPGANQSTCSAQLAQCLGYNPYTNPAQSQPTGSVQTTQPAGNPTATYTGPVAENPTTTGTQVQFTGAATINKPAAGLFAIGVGALAFL